jgi:hypothetical protein
MRKACSKCEKNCEPQCTWSCESPKCAQTCGPKCASPRCSVRCRGLESPHARFALKKQCHMECGKPSCRVVCPEKPCAASNCPKCKTECAKPQCSLKCRNGPLDGCRNACEQPKCQWQCTKPSACPKPKCAMKCEKPIDCMDDQPGGFTPPLEPGEMEVQSVDVPASPSPGPAAASAAFLQSGNGAASLLINFTSMGSDRTLHSGQVDLAMIQVDTADSVASSWVKEQIEVSGQVVEVEASCTNGKFKCQADADWCAEQRELICPTSQVSRSRSQLQGRLHA